MEEINQMIMQMTNGNPVFFYLFSGLFLLLCVFFLRKVLLIIGIMIAVLLIFIAFMHFTGHDVPLSIPENINLDSIIQFSKDLLDYLLSFVPKPDESVDNTKDLINAAKDLSK